MVEEYGEICDGVNGEREFVHPWCPCFAVRSGELQDRKSKDYSHSNNRGCWSLRITTETTCGSYARKLRISESVSYRVASLRGGKLGRWTWQLASVSTYGIAWCRGNAQQILVHHAEEIIGMRQTSSRRGIWGIWCRDDNTHCCIRYQTVTTRESKDPMPCRAIMHPSGNHSLIQLLSKPKSALVDGVCHLCTCQSETISFQAQTPQSISYRNNRTCHVAVVRGLWSHQNLDKW